MEWIVLHMPSEDAKRMRETLPRQLIVAITTLAKQNRDILDTANRVSLRYAQQPIPILFGDQRDVETAYFASDGGTHHDTAKLGPVRKKILKNVSRWLWH